MSPAGNIAEQKPQSGGSGEIIAADLACVQCGYNLRSLRMEGSCPECGRPVAHSQSRLFISGAAIWWLESMIRGAWLLSAYLVLQPLVAVAVIASAFIFHEYPWLVAIVFFMGGGGCIILFSMALWFLTRPYEGVHPTPKGRWWTIILQVLWVLYLAGYAIYLLIVWSTRGDPLALLIVAGLGGGLFLILRVGIVIGLSWHLRSLIAFMEDRALNILSRIIYGGGWALAVAGSSQLLLLLLDIDSVSLGCMLIPLLLAWWITLLAQIVKLWLHLSKIHSLRMR